MRHKHDSPPPMPQPHESVFRKGIGYYPSTTPVESDNPLSHDTSQLRGSSPPSPFELIDGRFLRIEYSAKPALYESGTQPRPDAE